MSSAINHHREPICLIREQSLAGLILHQIRNIPKDAQFEDSGTVIFLFEGFWYELSTCSLYRHDKDVVAVIPQGGASLTACNGNSVCLEEGIWRISCN
jgi:hypothetical protein